MLPFYLIGYVPFLKRKLRKMYINRANQIVPRITPFINSKDMVLDIGCGTGVISKLVQQKTNSKITLADVQYNAMCDQYPVIVYDGINLPFENKKFSRSLLLTVLHHCKEQSRVLDEAIRVTSGKIIVMEDIFDDLPSRAITFIGDCLVNWEIHSPFTNHKTEDWIRIFEKKKLKIENIDEFELKCIGFPFKIAIFVLSKK